jgi:starch synthase
MEIRGNAVEIILPRYRCMRYDQISDMCVSYQDLWVPWAGGAVHCTVWFGYVHGRKCYFIEPHSSDGFFERNSYYGDDDDVTRFAFFCKAALEFMLQAGKRPDVIHCHDWQTALVPVLLRTSYGDDPMVKDLPVVFTIHNMGYHGLFAPSVLESAGIPRSLFHPGGVEFFGKVNLLKGGLVYSDYLTTVSRKYSEEIQTAEYGHGLDGVARSRADRLVGILNGVDYSEWDPAKDKLIAAKYSAKDLGGKQVCKQDLLGLFGLSQEHLGRPVIGIVSRFADQKGFDLIAEKAHELMREELVLVALGTGERKYEDFFRALAAAYPGRMGVKIAYDNVIAHKIEAGADMFLMPSRYEPSGLNQMYSLKYGTVPIVRATGGLDDSIEPFDVEHGTGTGFKFKEYTGEALLFAVRQALHHYMDERIWKRIQLNGMAKDFSWKGPAAEYAKLYEAARALRGSGQTARGVGQAPQGPGQVKRNQKPAGTSN